MASGARPLSLSVVLKVHARSGVCQHSPKNTPLCVGGSVLCTPLDDGHVGLSTWPNGVALEDRDIPVLGAQQGLTAGRLHFYRVKAKLASARSLVQTA